MQNSIADEPEYKDREKDQTNVYCKRMRWHPIDDKVALPREAQMWSSLVTHKRDSLVTHKRNSLVTHKRDSNLAQRSTDVTLPSQAQTWSSLVKHKCDLA